MTSPHLLVRKKSPQPIYLQLFYEFKSKIDRGEWSFGSQIPSLEQLMAAYGVSRMTIRQALQLLEDEDYINRQQGRGTFVRKKPLSLLELQLPTTWEKTVELSDALATQSIMESNIRVDKLPEIGIEHGGELLPFYRYLCRVHTKEEQPYCYSEVFLDEQLYASFKQQLQNSAVVSVLARIPNLELKKARQSLSIIPASPSSAHALGLAYDDLVAEIRRTILAQGQLIYFARLEFPIKFVKFEIDLD